MDSLFTSLLNVFDDCEHYNVNLRYDPFTWKTITTYPINVEDVKQQEKDGKLIITIDAPGVKRPDVSVTTTKQRLDVSTIRDGKVKTYKYDIRSDYDLNTTDCKLVDGVLTITIAKKEKPPEELPRKVTVW